MMGERPARPAMPALIAFDADDTLWENEIYFETAKDRFKDLLAADCDPAWTERELYETEMRNLSHFGYGIKGFTLSMIETALDLTKGAVTGQQLRQILDYGKELLQMPIEPLPHVAEVLTDLSRTRPLMLLTKGDLFDQEAKIARSGLADYFTYIEIVSEKNEGTYAALLQAPRQSSRRTFAWWAIRSNRIFCPSSRWVGTPSMCRTIPLGSTNAPSLRRPSASNTTK